MGFLADHEGTEKQLADISEGEGLAVGTVTTIGQRIEIDREAEVEPVRLAVSLHLRNRRTNTERVDLLVGGCEKQDVPFPVGQSGEEFSRMQARSETRFHVQEPTPRKEFAAVEVPRHLCRRFPRRSRPESSPSSRPWDSGHTPEASHSRRSGRCRSARTTGRRLVRSRGHEPGHSPEGPIFRQEAVPHSRLRPKAPGRSREIAAQTRLHRPNAIRTQCWSGGWLWASTAAGSDKACAPLVIEMSLLKECASITQDVD